MALFDVGVWTKKRPSALKGSGIAAAFKKWEKAVPNDDPATVTSEEDYQAAVDAIETAMLVAGRTITTEKKKLETECEKKKKGLKDKQKEKKIDEQYDEEVKKWLPVTNQLGFWKTDLANFDRRYQAAKSKALGLYDKHLKEIMDAYKTCVEGMNATEKDAVKLLIAGHDHGRQRQEGRRGGTGQVKNSGTNAPCRRSRAGSMWWMRTCGKSTARTAKAAAL